MSFVQPIISLLLTVKCNIISIIMSIVFYSVTMLKRLALCHVNTVGDTGHLEIDTGGLPSADSQASLVYTHDK